MIDFPPGVFREGNSYKRVHISDLIQSVLEDVHSIEKTLFSITTKFDSAITIISGANLQSKESETTRDDLMIYDLMITKDRLVLPQIFSKEQYASQNTDPEYTSNLLPLPDFQKCVPQSNQADVHTVLQRKNSQCDVFTGSLIEIVRQEEDNILCEAPKSPKNDGLRLFKEDAGEVKKKPVQEDKRDKKAVKIDAVVMDECISWTQSCITVG